MSIATWRNEILPRLSGATDAMVQEEIKRTITNFCRESTAWRDMIYALNVDINDREVELQVADGTRALVIGVLRVYRSSGQISQLSHAPSENASSTPMGFTVRPDNPSVIVLSTIPTESLVGELDAYVYCEPVDSTTYLPPVILRDFWEHIFDGALGRMYSHPSRPYSDPPMAQYHLKRYRQGTRIARAQANRGFTGNAQNWTFPSFGR